jgi:hypothetical protein
MPKAPAPPITTQQPADPVARVAVEADVRRGPVLHVPLTISVEALVQDNGNGTWTVAVPSMTRGIETAPSLRTALLRMADALSWTITA